MNPREPNPYESPAATGDDTGRRPRLFRRLVVLNACLVLLPFAIVLLSYLAVRIEMAREAASSNGDVVTYDVEFVGVSGPWILPLTLYLLVPNLVLLIWMAVAAWRN